MTGEVGLRGTPFHQSTAARCNTTWWYGWGGYAVPDVYSDLHTELEAIHTRVSMNEMSPIPKTEIVGPDARDCVDYLITRDVSKMEVGHAWYSPWCNEDGKVVADGIVFHLAPDRFILSGDNSTEFFRQVAPRFDVSIGDVTDGHGILALQGPKSRAVLEAATNEDWSGLRFSHIRETQIGGAQVRVARQGFTGELGYELWVERPDGQAVWETVAAAGAAFDLEPAGEYAIDIARVEAGLILVSAEYTSASTEEPSSDVPANPVDHVTPYELNLGHCVKLDKSADFVGRRALVTEHEAGPSRRIVGLEFGIDEIVQLFRDNGLAPDISPRVRWDHLPLRHDGDVVGRASSVTWSPTTSRLIGFGLVPIELTATGTLLSVDWADFWGAPLGPIPATVCDYPFIELGRRT